MMNDFMFYNPVKVYFGKEKLKNLAGEVSKHAKKVLLVYGGGSIKRNGIDIKADVDYVVSGSASLQKELKNFEKIVQKYTPLAEAAQTQGGVSLWEHMKANF